MCRAIFADNVNGNLIDMRLLVFEIVRAAEVILGARAADGGELLVAIHKEFDFPLTPPTGIVSQMVIVLKIPV